MAVTDTIKSVKFDDFCLQYVMDPLDEWNDGKFALYIERYCIRDDACWYSLSDKSKERGHECFQTLMDVIKGKDETTDDWREQICKKKNYCNLNEMGWTNNPVILRGHLEIESIENKDTFRAIMKFTPKTLSTYGKTFHLTSKEQKMRILFDKTISISGVSDSEQKFMELIQNIIIKKKEADFNDLGIIFDTSRIIVGGILTTKTCLSIPDTAGVGVIQCISGVGSTIINIGELSNKIKFNDELKLQIKDYVHIMLNEEKEDL